MLGLLSVAALGAVAAAVAVLPPGSGTAPGPRDALHAETLAELRAFTGWLRRHGVHGYVGEVGWPDDRRGDAEAWNGLAEAWYDEADRERLWVTAWAVGTWLGSSYPLSVYDHGEGGFTPSDQAAVIERRAPKGALRGVAIAGGEFGADREPFSNAAPGSHGVDYRFEPAGTFRYLAGRGHRLARIAFRWERVQPTLGGPLDPAETARLRDTVRRAHAAGLSVVLDLHNFGEYRAPEGPLRLGSQITAATFADTWRRLALAFRTVPGIVGYGLMNEPAHVQAGEAGSPERAWERSSQAAVTAIRSTGDARTVLVGGYPWSSVHDWPAHHPQPWIADPRRNVRYEAHHYWDTDRTGTYPATYGEELAAARRR